MTARLIDRIIAGYRQLRDIKKSMQERHKEELAPINAKLARLEAAMLQQMDELGVDSFKTPDGTAYRSERRTYKVEDGDAFFTYVVDHHLTHLLEKRVAKAAADEYLESQGELPPGVRVDIEQRANFRAPAK